MGILIESQTAAADSDGFFVEDKAVLMASSGIATGEDCAIEVYSVIDGWTDSLEVLSSEIPVSLIEGPCRYRISKPSSSSAFGVELKLNVSSGIGI